MNKHLLIFMFLCLFALSGCATAAPMSEYAPSAPLPADSEGSSSSRPAASGSSTAADVTSSLPEDTQRIVIKNASLSVTAKDPEVTMSDVAHMAEEMGGFVVSSNMYKVTLDSGLQVPRANISIRIPADRFTEALDRIAGNATQVLGRNETGQDVTSEYTDLQSRLRNLQATEKQLIQIMDSATKTEDVLSVLNQLTYIREQIEVLEGRIKYYNESAAFSLIEVSIQADAAVQPLTIGGWQPVGVAREALQSLLDTFRFLMNALIWIVLYVVPVTLLFVLVILLPLRWGFRGLRVLWQRLVPTKTSPPAAPKDG